MGAAPPVADQLQWLESLHLWATEEVDRLRGLIGKLRFDQPESQVRCLLCDVMHALCFIIFFLTFLTLELLVNLG